MKRIKALLATIICICVITGLTGCAANDDYMNDVKGNLSGNSYTIYTYDNYGQKVMTTTGTRSTLPGIKPNPRATIVREMKQPATMYLPSLQF